VKEWWKMRMVIRMMNWHAWKEMKLREAYEMQQEVDSRDRVTHIERKICDFQRETGWWSSNKRRRASVTRWFDRTSVDSIHQIGVAQFTITTVRDKKNKTFPRQQFCAWHIPWQWKPSIINLVLQKCNPNVNIWSNL